MRFCACIDTLYTEYPFSERFAKAKADGFESVEFWDYRHHDLDGLKKSAVDAGINISGTAATAADLVGAGAGLVDDAVGRDLAALDGRRVALGPLHQAPRADD